MSDFVSVHKMRVVQIHLWHLKVQGRNVVECEKLKYEVSCPVVFLERSSKPRHSNIKADSGTKAGHPEEVCEMLGLFRLPSTLP